MSARLTLASTSPQRRAILEQLRIPFEVVAPTYVEGDPPGLEPADLVRLHAEGKARSVHGAGRLTLGVDTRTAAGSDDLQDTVDYGTLVAAVKQAIENDPVDLIETLAQRIADLCLADPRVGWTEVTVHKPQAPIEATFSDVALTIHRSRQ